MGISMFRIGVGVTPPPLRSQTLILIVVDAPSRYNQNGSKETVNRIQ